jgi:hypothetical protein
LTVSTRSEPNLPSFASARTFSKAQARSLDLAFRQEPGLDHVRQDVVSAGAGGREVDVGRVLGRRLEQPGEHGRFGERQVLDLLAEIVVRRRRDPVVAAAHVGAVEVELQDLVLGQVELEPDREKGFLDLALQRALVRQEQVLGELLGDGRAALHLPASRIARHRPDGADRVDAPMLEEAPVLGGERRLDEVVGIVLELDGIVVPDAPAADLLPVAVEKGDRELLGLQPVVRGLAKGGQGEPEHDDAPRHAERQRLAGEVEHALLCAAHGEPVEPLGIGLPGRGQAAAAVEEGGVEPRVEG